MAFASRRRTGLIPQWMQKPAEQLDRRRRFAPGSSLPGSSEIKHRITGTQLEVRLPEEMTTYSLLLQSSQN